MPLRLAIHVGPHKTGSTSVQRALVSARGELAMSGVWYPPSLPLASWPDQHADVETRGRAWWGWMTAAEVRGRGLGEHCGV